VSEEAKAANVAFRKGKLKAMMEGIKEKKA
jgi:hypothetical protein